MIFRRLAEKPFREAGGCYDWHKGVFFNEGMG